MVWIRDHQRDMREVRVDLRQFKWLELLGVVAVQRRKPLVFVTVEVPTLKILLALLQFLLRVLLLCIFARHCLVHHRVENLLFPSVVPAAVALQWAALFILSNKVAGLPPLAYLKRIVRKQLGLSPEVLPIVRVDALCLVVLSVEGAPLCFEVKHVELLVTRHLVNQWSLYVRVSVREGAELFVFTFLRGLGAKFGLVLLNVVKALNLIVGVLAVHV